MKLLPQYSIRLMLGITASVAVVFSVVGLAVRGHGWAIGISLGVTGVTIALVTYAAFFGILWVFSVVSSPFLNRRFKPGRRTMAGTSSPFAVAGGVPTAETAVEAIVIDAPDAAVDRTTDSFGGDR